MPPARSKQFLDGAHNLLSANDSRVKPCRSEFELRVCGKASDPAVEPTITDIATYKMTRFGFWLVEPAWQMLDP